MPFAQRLLLVVPPMVLGISIVLISVIISIAGLLLMRRFMPHQRLKLHNDVAGFIFTTLGVLYAVLLAFIVIIVWENFDKSQVNAEMEANYLTDLYTDSTVFPEDFRAKIQNYYFDYARVVANDEWKILGTDKTFSPKAKEIVKNIWQLYASYEPKTEAQKIFYQESVEKLNKFCELRRLRILDAKTGIEPLLWFVLISGGIITIVFTFFFGTENVKPQMIMTALLAAIIALILFTILEFDYPFTGVVSVNPEGFRLIAEIGGIK